MNLRPNDLVDIDIQAYTEYVRTHFTGLFNPPPTNRGTIIETHPKHQQTWRVKIGEQIFPIPERFILEPHGPYCDRCGACWVCEGGDPCRDGGEHTFG